MTNINTSNELPPHKILQKNESQSWKNILTDMTLYLRNFGFHEIVDPTPCFLHFLQYARYITFGLEQVLS